MNAKSNRIWKILSSLVLLLAAGTQGLLLWRVHRLNILPRGYMLALCGVFVLITGLLGVILFPVRRGKCQKTAGPARRLLGYLLCAAAIAGCMLGSSVVGRVLGTISAITAPEKVNVVLEVYVREEDPAQYVQDTTGYTFALSSDVPEEETRKILEELETLLGYKLETVYYPGTVAMLDALLAGEADAVILNSAYLDVLDGMEGYESIGTKLRLLHELVIEKETPRETKPLLQENSREFDVTKDPFLIYISGNDSRRSLLADGGSDVNILFLVNPQTHQILLINTPRDYYVVNPASENGSRDKLSHCGLAGIENCVEAMSGLYGQDIRYYARINFYGFRTLVDAIGGVTVYTPVTFYGQGYTFTEGENHLNGDQALAFARERKSLRGGDNDRGKNQMRLISAMIQQLSVDNILSNYTEILESLEGMFSTNFPAEDIGSLVQLQLSQMPSWEILTFAVTGDNGNDMCWAAGGYGYVMYPHEDKVAHAVELITRFLDGEVLTEADLQMK